MYELTFTDQEHLFERKVASNSSVLEIILRFLDNPIELANVTIFQPNTVLSTSPAIQFRVVVPAIGYSGKEGYALLDRYCRLALDPACKLVVTARQLLFLAQANVCLQTLDIDKTARALRRDMLLGGLPLFHPKQQCLLLPDLICRFIPKDKRGDAVGLNTCPGDGYCGGCVDLVPFADHASAEDLGLHWERGAGCRTLEQTSAAEALGEERAKITPLKVNEHLGWLKKKNVLGNLQLIKEAVDQQLLDMPHFPQELKDMMMSQDPLELPTAESDAVQGSWKMERNAGPRQRGVSQGETHQEEGQRDCSGYVLPMGCPASAWLCTPTWSIRE